MTVIPRKLPKFKIKKTHKVKFNANHPRTPYEYTVQQLRILTNKNKKNNKQLQSLRKILINLITSAHITYHGPDCYISTKKEILTEFFQKHTEKLHPINHPEFNRLSKIYYSIKLLTK
jgi:hypothetical protein